MCILSLTGYAESIQSGSNGISITDDAAAAYRIATISIDGQRFRKITMPETYYSSGSFPETETFGRMYTFAVPEGSVPSLSFQSPVSASFATSDLAPVKTFSKDKRGIYSEVYQIPEFRNDKELPHAEIVKFGRYGEMELYRLIVRPLVIRGGVAELSVRTDAKITFSRGFSNGKSTQSGSTGDKFLDTVINLDYGLANPLHSVKTKEPCFLDRNTEWVKLKIRDEGVYRITGASLRALGLDLSAVLCDRIKVYSGAGKDLENNPTTASYHGA